MNKIINIHDNTYSKEELLNHKTFCVLPWVHFHAWPEGSIYPCCQTNYKNPIDQYAGQPFNAIMNNAEFKKLRVDMLNGKKSKKYCCHCINLEDKFQQESPRIRKNKQFIRDHFDTVTDAIKTTAPDGEIDFTLRDYDIRFSNICNLKCRTCGHNLSSTWGAEAISTWADTSTTEYQSLKKNGIIKITDISKNILSDMLDDKTLLGLKQLYFAGGEPLLMPEHYQILEGLIRVGNTKVKLSYNTNFTKLVYAGKDVLGLWANFPDLNIGTSIDDINTRLSYTRCGASWDEVVSNFDKFHSRIENSKFKIHNSITVSLFNIFYLPEIITEFYARNLINKDNQWSIHLNMVYDPTHFSITVLPIAFKKIINDRITNFMNSYDFGNELLKTNLVKRLTFMLELMNSRDDSGSMNIAAAEIFKYDKIRNEDFTKIFEEANRHLNIEQYAN
jgi:hypothetical protein